MTQLKDIPIGTTFTHKGRKIYVEPMNETYPTCSGCAFINNPLTCRNYSCGGKVRKDGRNVIFIEMD